MEWWKLRNDAGECWGETRKKLITPLKVEFVMRMAISIEEIIVCVTCTRTAIHFDELVLVLLTCFSYTTKWVRRPMCWLIMTDARCTGMGAYCCILDACTFASRCASQLAFIYFAPFHRSGTSWNFYTKYKIKRKTNSFMVCCEGATDGDDIHIRN